MEPMHFWFSQTLKCLHTACEQAEHADRVKWFKRALEALENIDDVDDRDRARTLTDIVCTQLNIGRY